MADKLLCRVSSRGLEEHFNSLYEDGEIGGVTVSAIDIPAAGFSGIPPHRISFKLQSQIRFYSPYSPLFSPSPPGFFLFLSPLPFISLVSSLFIFNLSFSLLVVALPPPFSTPPYFCLSFSLSLHFSAPLVFSHLLVVSLFSLFFSLFRSPQFSLSPLLLPFISCFPLSFPLLCFFFSLSPLPFISCFSSLFHSLFGCRVFPPPFFPSTPGFFFSLFSPLPFHFLFFLSLSTPFWLSSSPPVSSVNPIFFLSLSPSSFHFLHLSFISSPFRSPFWLSAFFLFSSPYSSLSLSLLLCPLVFLSLLVVAIRFSIFPLARFSLSLPLPFIYLVFLLPLIVVALLPLFFHLFPILSALSSSPAYLILFPLPFGCRFPPPFPPSTQIFFSLSLLLVFHFLFSSPPFRLSALSHSIFPAPPQIFPFSPASFSALINFCFPIPFGCPLIPRPFSSPPDFLSLSLPLPFISCFPLLFWLSLFFLHFPLLPDFLFLLFLSAIIFLYPFGCRCLLLYCPLLPDSLSALLSSQLLLILFHSFWLFVLLLPFFSLNPRFCLSLSLNLLLGAALVFLSLPFVPDLSSSVFLRVNPRFFFSLSLSSSFHFLFSSLFSTSLLVVVLLLRFLSLNPRFFFSLSLSLLLLQALVFLFPFWLSLFFLHFPFPPIFSPVSSYFQLLPFDFFSAPLSFLFLSFSVSLFSLVVALLLHFSSPPRFSLSPLPFSYYFPLPFGCRSSSFISPSSPILSLSPFPLSSYNSLSTPFLVSFLPPLFLLNQIFFLLSSSFHLLFSSSLLVVALLPPFSSSYPDFLFPPLPFQLLFSSTLWFALLLISLPPRFSLSLSLPLPFISCFPLSFWLSLFFLHFPLLNPRFPLSLFLSFQFFFSLSFHSFWFVSFSTSFFSIPRFPLSFPFLNPSRFSFCFISPFIFYTLFLLVLFPPIFFPSLGVFLSLFSILPPSISSSSSPSNTHFLSYPCSPRHSPFLLPPFAKDTAGEKEHMLGEGHSWRRTTLKGHSLEKDTAGEGHSWRRDTAGKDTAGEDTADTAGEDSWRRTQWRRTQLEKEHSEVVHWRVIRF
ncbi:hypothetical protein C7M84_010755 [Penaeus vannamei]|uniref:Uncharacterized protein n=1 Tax=Penaeus vannamei TaxID=6689 RepID=A0A3R7PM36_PENVA|nr:hypothetical protein C7M84_010755 [Penaeus vannamei]